MSTKPPLLRSSFWVLVAFCAIIAIHVYFLGSSVSRLLGYLTFGGSLLAVTLLWLWIRSSEIETLLRDNTVRAVAKRLYIFWWAFVVLHVCLLRLNDFRDATGWIVLGVTVTTVLAFYWLIKFVIVGNYFQSPMVR